MAYVMDTNEEERFKGITVEVGRAYFETETTRFTILDAPGHKSYVPNMITGASQADVGVLVVSARRGEFEAGYEKGGQTCEHVQLAKTLGVTKLIVVVNKMDDPTVEWSKQRYDDIMLQMIPLLKSSGYKVKQDVQFLPMSGLHGTNLEKKMDKVLCSWWKGSCLIEALDMVDIPQRHPEGPLRMPIVDKYKDLGTVVMGKVERGTIHENDTLQIMPNKAQVRVTAVYSDEHKVENAGPGENLHIKLSGVEDEEILRGFILSSLEKPVPVVNELIAQLQIHYLRENAIITAGYKAVMHVHSVVEECEIVELKHKIEKRTGRKMPVMFSKTVGDVVECRIQVNHALCLEKYDVLPQLGRFTLRSEGMTVAAGKIIDFPFARDST